MLHNLARLGRYRGLIQSLVARELKARYRGSVLGFFWSFINPLLLLLVYSFVFKYVLPAKFKDVDHYELFLFCGLLPWTWFSSSLLESSGVLISGGNLIKKVLFPAEILPIVTVIANLVHFLLGLSILAVFLIYYQRPLYFVELAWFPVAVIVQLVFTLGCALLLSAVTVHFRDVRDILGHLITFWFFATPIIYPVLPDGSLADADPEPQSVHAPRDYVSGDPVLQGSGRALEMAACGGRGVGRVLPVRLFRVRPVARYVCGGGMTESLVVGR